MSYYITLRDVLFSIREENKGPCLEVIKELSKNGRYSWVNNSIILSSNTLEQALEEWNWELDEEIKRIEPCGEKLGDEDVLFKAIAPFVEEGSYLELEGEDGFIWRWEFRGGKLIELVGTVVFEER